MIIGPALAPAPGQHHPVAGANARPTIPSITGLVSASPVGTALARAGTGYLDWLDHVWAAAGCTQPVRLFGQLHTVEPGTGQLLSIVPTTALPDAVLYKACGNRRAAVCPSCAETYRRDAYQLIRAGLVGGKGVPDTVAAHPAVFATLTAPSFGLVHTRVVPRHTCAERDRCDCRPQPCHARPEAPLCLHCRPLACHARHEPSDPRLGTPLCLDCYDHAGQVVWNLHAGELWRRTKQAIERYLARLARERGIPFPQVATAAGISRKIPPLRVSHGRAAEFQTRGAVHFHVLLRLDGLDPADPDAIVPPPAGLTVDDLTAAVRHASGAVGFVSDPHPANPDGWPVGWGAQLDIRPITLRGDGTVSDQQVAGYLAKYATKSTEATGHTSRRITSETLDLYGDPHGSHPQRLVHACWTLGRPTETLDPDSRYRKLRRWAHMLGYGGHFLTKARHYSITFGALRAARIHYRRGQDTGPDQATIRPADEQATIVVGLLSYAGTGWHTTGDALLANTAANQARERTQAGRDELTHETAIRIAVGEAA